MSEWLRLISNADAVRDRRRPVDSGTLREAALIVEDIRRDGEVALRRHSERLGDITPGETLVAIRRDLDEALAGLDECRRRLLDRAAQQIRSFAQAQRDAIDDIDVEVPGGRAGHSWIPVRTAGAYAPGGRYPLPSSVLMTVIPARVAGVEAVWVASPKPTRLTMAVAALAGADGLLKVGGAQAVAALSFGILSPPCDLVVGPGNRWVTAAKKHLFGEIGIDGLAGPSEIVVIAEDSADPHLVAADLLAQAEHDVDALPILVTTSSALRENVEFQITRQLQDLATADVAAVALGNGFCTVVDDLEQAAALSEQIGPEHLALHVSDPETLAGKLGSYGSLFMGEASAEAFADYGIGPNHVLPTGGGARFQSGLSVMTFLKSPTWIRLTKPREVVADSAALARIEGLEAHARAAELRG
ncbi:histidinol dehydrogenase [bacterium BMS3Abin02]|nr:histidinol dehydrogenase [bacterium BMS3Abin02]GBE23654.1 histidinol dehydrogenase [bacterium BMS3Bbin01]HDH26358.1 histidinol dehydrogenase [Actinomycetota bacterium]